jgi:hypothetical protein
MNRFRFATALTLGALLAGGYEFNYDYSFSGKLGDENIKSAQYIGECFIDVGHKDHVINFLDSDCDGKINWFRYDDARGLSHYVFSSSKTEQAVFAEAQRQYTAYLAKIKAEKERAGLEALGVKN